MNDLSITGLILAGGRGARMGGVDKGLQNFNGTPLTLHTLMRLQMQDAVTVSEMMIIANRNLSAYESFGVQVWPDSTDNFAGPLAGFLTGLERCETDLLLTVPCDSPLFPLNLTQRLLDTLIAEDAEIAVAAAKEEDGSVRAQPVFCLMRVSLLESLVKFMQSGGRKIDAWTAQHTTVLVPFDTDDVDPRAFFNANTLDELHRLEQSK
ncbi:molybdenum cofactor guanylyltransferase MobA [Limnohabitans sp. MMS-10A-178]|jgi:molybdopterin-guanine dinucleotide biosynthesis protein A|uniref:molybdenum cofactor guanylyltransferase MobA n=1 Tax=Limnohabitans sp. MMS-10A-178 TaxID=1835767 RepID=UPI000D393258|nr:molybdenum cofactor guanylyltransferase MobA [Limnohabitans sp. MMS-10A-178]PUE15034.1 molybdenum cofactor guanylyltransferase MobA [Limnohabitans sp. MMS-10A-178]